MQVLNNHLNKSLRIALAAICYHIGNPNPLVTTADKPAGYNPQDLASSQSTQTRVYGQNSQATAANGIAIYPSSGTIPSFVITSAGTCSYAAGALAKSVNGVFGPVGTSNSLYSLMNGLAGTANIATITPNWIMTLSDD